MTSLRHCSIGDYLEKLASAQPTPGGGAAAALSGAQACALLAMTLRISLGTVEPSLAITSDQSLLLGDLDMLRNSFMTLMDTDGEAFNRVLSAYSLARQSPEQKAARKKAIGDGLLTAAQVSFEILRLTNTGLEMGSRVLPLAKPTIVSDAIIAVHLLKAAMEASRCNVLINLKYLINYPDMAMTLASLRQDLESQISTFSKQYDMLTTQGTQLLGMPSGI